MSFLDRLQIDYTEERDRKTLENWLSLPKETLPFPFQGKEIAGALDHWMGFAKHKGSLSAKMGQEVCGVATLFLMPYRKIAHHASFFIFVAPSWRRRGVGTILLKNLLHLADAYFGLESLHGEVYESQPVLSLLKKVGFQPIFSQAGFMKEGLNYRAREVWQFILPKGCDVEDSKGKA